MPPAPQLPACINPQTMIGNCRKPVYERYRQSVSSFNAALEDYNRVTRSYVDGLNAWMIASGQYGQCEVDRVNRATQQLNRSIPH